MSSQEALQQVSSVSSGASEHSALRGDLDKLCLEMGKLAAKTEVVSRSKEELVEELNKLKRDKDELSAQLAEVQGSMQKNHAETANKILQMKSGSDVGYEQLSKQTSDLKHTVAQLSDTIQAAVQDVAALKERMEIQSMALQSMEMREEAEKQFRRLNIERLLDATVKDAVSAAMKDGPEQEHERVKAELSSAQGAALLQSPPKTIHDFDFFAHLGGLQFGNVTKCGDSSITVTLVRGSDALQMASAVAPTCKVCREADKYWVDDPEALRQAVTGLLDGAAGGQQRWAYVYYFRIDNLSYVNPFDLKERKPLPPASWRFLPHSVGAFQAWLRSSPDVAITDADVTRR